VRAGVVALTAWAERHIPPYRAPRIDIATLGPVSVAHVDAYGNATGGVRSPYLDVPLSHYEAHSSPGPICALAGRETPLSTAQLAARYASPDSYMRQFTRRTDLAIRRGYLLRQDRFAILLTQALRADAVVPDSQHHL